MTRGCKASDTLHSSGVFGQEAAPNRAALGDAGKRFMSMQDMPQDAFVTEVVHAPGRSWGLLSGRD